MCTFNLWKGAFTPKHNRRRVFPVIRSSGVAIREQRRETCVSKFLPVTGIFRHVLVICVYTKPTGFRRCIQLMAAEKRKCK